MCCRWFWFFLCPCSTPYPWAAKHACRQSHRAATPQRLMLISRDGANKRKEEPLQHLVKVSNDLVQQPQTFHSHIVTIQLDVEIIKVWDWGKQDADLWVGLIVEVLMRKTKFINQALRFVLNSLLPRVPPCSWDLTRGSVEQRAQAEDWRESSCCRAWLSPCHLSLLQPDNQKWSHICEHIPHFHHEGAEENLFGLNISPQRHKMIK